MATTKTTKRQAGSDIVKALEAVWTEIVKRNPELPDVVMITGSGLDLLGAKWAHFWRERWIDKNDKTKRPELFLSGERLYCGAELTLQSLLHEAAHALAEVRGIKDTSRQNRYHNREFVKCAQELGLDYTHEKPDSTIGFSAVTLTEDGKAAYADVIAKLDKAIKIHLPGFEDYGISATGGDGTHTMTTAGGSKLRRRTVAGPSRNNLKAVCQCETPRIIRVSRSVLELGAISCGECGKNFEVQE